jgi:glycerol uptake facilitator-like aquaporin
MMLMRRLAAEGLGTALLTATVVGSGVMAQRLAQGNDAIALLANTGATVAALATLIALFAPVSGAHFNPVVSVALTLLRRHRWSEAAGYATVQVVGAVAGTMLAHAMFALPLVQASIHVRTGPAVWLSPILPSQLRAH